MRTGARWAFSIIVAILCALSAASQAAGEVQEYRLVPISTIFAGSDPPYSLTREETNNVPPTLLGLKLASDGLYICDDVTDRLIKLDFEGSEVFSVGSRGSGPEDHIGTGEPISWPGCAVARTDCSESPKLICYNEHGSFLRSIRLEGFNQYLRILRGGTRGFGLALVMEWRPENAIDLTVYLAAISDKGALLDSVLVGQRRLEYPTVPREEDFEITPRLVSDGAGRLYMQRDVYSWDVECFDEDLNLIWRRRKDVNLIPRSSEERQGRGPWGDASATHHHAIRQIYPRSGGDVWIQETAGSGDPGEIRLTRLDDKGQDAGEVIIRGLPEAYGDMLIVDERVVWKRDDDVKVVKEELYLAVFRLVPA